jgi:hypothetical protein
MKDLASRLKSRGQLTTDGHKAYLQAIEGAFGAEIEKVLKPLPYDRAVYRLV